MAQQGYCVDLLQYPSFLVEEVLQAGADYQRAALSGKNSKYNPAELVKVTKPFKGRML